jgi:hypothetical protein
VAANGSYVILTSAPWTIPETRLIVGNGWRHPDKDTRVRIKVYTLRDLPAGAVNDGQAQEAKLVGTSVTLQEAEQMVHNAEDLSSPMVSVIRKAKSKVLTRSLSAMMTIVSFSGVCGLLLC